MQTLGINRLIESLFRQRILQHILFWIVIIMYFTIGYTRDGNYGLELYRSFIFSFNHMFIVYSFLYVLIPKFLLPKKFFWFFVSALIVYWISIYFSGLINEYILGLKKTSWSIGAAILGQSTVLGLAISVKLLKGWYRHKQELFEAESQKKAAQLQLLKSQVHPHFLFNTLNNLYAHTLESTTKAPEIVLKLSNLLRFMIYESSADFIPLKKELELLKEYIGLEQLRYGERLDVSFHITGEIANRKIVPLLLLPLVENAFKHGTSKQIEKCWISFYLEVAGHQMNFKLVNSKDLHTSTGKPGGLGLKNVKKRLDLCYPGRHKFELTEDDDVFVVSLQLVLDADLEPVKNLSSSTALQDDMEMLISR